MYEGEETPVLGRDVIAARRGGVGYKQHTGEEVDSSTQGRRRLIAVHRGGGGGQQHSGEDGQVDTSTRRRRSKIAGLRGRG